MKTEVSDDIKEKARKLKELADKGIGGEKTNAQRMLDDFLRRHKLKWEDVDDSRFLRHIRVPNMTEARRLLIECILSVMPEAKIQENIAKKSIRVQLEDIQYVEVLDKFQFFWKAFQKKREVLLLAFFNKHKKFFFRELNPKYNPKADPSSPLYQPDDQIIKDMEYEQVRIADSDDEDFWSTGGDANPEHNSYMNSEEVMKKSEAYCVEQMMKALEDLYYVKSSRSINLRKKP